MLIGEHRSYELISHGTNRHQIKSSVRLSARVVNPLVSYFKQVRAFIYVGLQSAQFIEACVSAGRLSCVQGAIQQCPK